MRPPRRYPMASRHRSLACLVVCAVAEGAEAQPVPDFPAQDWTPLAQGGIVLADPSGDTALGQPGRDVVGCNANNPPGQTCTPDAPGAFVSSDAGFLYFRLRLAAAPNVASFGYGCEIDSDGDDLNYEFLALAGKNGVQSWQNTLGRTDSTADAADVLLQSYAPASSYEQSSTATDLGSFVDWAIAWSDLSGAGTPLATPLRFVCGANSNDGPSLTNGTGADLLGDESAGSTLWHLLASDPYQCDSSLCVRCPAAPFGTLAATDHTTFMTGQINEFAFYTPHGCPLPTLSAGGALPAGVSFDPATSRLAGTPDASAIGDYPITVTAGNGVPDDLVAGFTLSVVLGDNIFANGFETPP